MANQTSFCEKEHLKLIRIINFRLPYSFKKLGLIAAVLVFMILLSTKFIGSNTLLVKDVLRTLVLLFLLIASLSKEKIEDEYKQHIRFQSYMLAFVLTTVYCITIPLITFVLDALITNIRGEGTVGFYEMSSFEVIFIILVFQILFFEALKRYGRAE